MIKLSIKLTSIPPKYRDTFKLIVEAWNKNNDRIIDLSSSSPYYGEILESLEHNKECYEKMFRELRYLILENIKSTKQYDKMLSIICLEDLVKTSNPR